MNIAYVNDPCVTFILHGML